MFLLVRYYEAMGLPQPENAPLPHFYPVKDVKLLARDLDNVT